MDAIHDLVGATLAGIDAGPAQAHVSLRKEISNVFDCDSGLWHQTQRSGQPFRKTAVRMPGPSCREERWMSKIIPVEVIMIITAEHAQCAEFYFNDNL